MQDQLAMLGIGVDSRPVGKAGDALERFKLKATGAAHAGDTFTSSAGRVSKASTVTATAVGSAGAAMGRMLVGLVSVGAVLNSVGQARRFGAAIDEVTTLIEGNAQQVKYLREETIRMSNAYGGSAVQNVQAFYQAISAGASDLGAASDVVEQANKLATGGITDVATGVNVLSTALNAYGRDVLTAVEVSDTLFVGMKGGQTTIGELSNSLGNAIPIAAAVGVSLKELVAGASALTTQGQTTSVAMTGMRAIMATVIKPTKEAADVAKALGIEFNAAGLESKGMAAFLEEVIDKTGGSKTELGKLFGSIEALNAVLSFAGGGGEKFNQILDEMADMAGVTEEALAKMLGGEDNRAARAFERITNLSIRFGSVLLTIAVPAMESFASAAELVADNVGFVIGAAGAAALIFGGQFAIAVGTSAVAAITGAISSMIALELALGATSVSAAVAGVAVKAFSASLVLLKGALILTGIGALIVGAGLLVNWFMKLAEATGGWGNALSALGTLAAGIWEGIETSAASLGPSLSAIWQTIASGFYSMLEGISLVWHQFLSTMANGMIGIAPLASTMDSLNEAAGNAAFKMGEWNAKAVAASSNAATLTAKADALSQKGWFKASQALKTLNQLMDTNNDQMDNSEDAAQKLKDALSELEDSLGDDSGSGSGVAGGAAKATEKLSEMEQGLKSIEEGAVTSLSGAIGELFTGGIRSMSDFSDAVIDIMKRTLSDLISLAVKNKITISIGAAVSGTGGLLSQATAAGGSSSDSTSGLTGLLGQISGIGSALTSGIGLGLSSLFGAGGGVGTYLGALGAQAGVAFGGAFSASALAGLAGMALPVIGAFAILAKGLSRKYAGSGIRGNFDSEGFTGAQFDFYKGGFLRSNKTELKPLDSGFESALDDTMIALSNSIVDMSSSLGLSTEALEGFTSQDFQIWINGKSPEEVQEALAQIIEDTGSEMAALVLGTEEYSLAGETALETMSRLSSSLLSVNDAADILGHRIWEVSLASADMASSLVDAFGGMDAMTSAVGTYWNAFYTEAERQETTIRRLTEEFEELGMALPESRESFRQIVEGIDTTTEAGRQLYADLLNLSGALDAVLGPLFGFSPEITSMINGVTTIINAQIEERRELAAEAEANSRLQLQVANSLRDFIVDLQTTSLGGLNPFQVLEASAKRYSDVFTAAKGGDQEAAGDFLDSAKSYLNAASDTAGSLTDYQRVARRVARDTQLVAGISEFEGAKDQYQADLYEAQISVLEEMRTLLQSGDLTSEALAELNGTLTGLQEVIEAAEVLSYEYLTHNLDLVLELLPTADIPPALRNIIEAAGGSLETLIDLIFRSDDLSPAMRFFLAGEAVNAIATLEVLITDPAIPLSRFIATGVLDGVASLIAEISVGTPASLAALLEDGVFDVSTLISGRIIGKGAAANLLSQIGEATRSFIDVEGRFEFDPSSDLESWFSESLEGGMVEPINGLTTSMSSLETSITNLIQGLASERAAAEAEAERIAKASKVQAKLDKFDENWGANSTANAANLISEIEALQASTGVNLLNGSGAATLRQRSDGTIAYSATSRETGTNSDYAAFQAAFDGDGGLQARIAQVNANVNRANDYEARLLDNLSGLQSFDGGGSTGSGSRTGGADGKGGFHALLHPGEHVVDKQGGGDVFGTGAMVAELAAIKVELASARAESSRAQSQMVKNTDTTASTLRRWDINGLPPEEV